MANADVVVPEAFNERFTIYLNADGKPVQRAVREMKAAEALAAIAWHGEETNRDNGESL